MVNFCLIWVVYSFLLYILEAPICSHVVETAQGLQDIVPKENVVFAHRILGFHFFFSIFVFAHGFT
jgi:hypothetical protein